MSSINEIELPPSQLAVIRRFIGECQLRQAYYLNEGEVMVKALKCVPALFPAVAIGEKTAEIRFNDRNYQVGDILAIAEYDAEEDSFSGRMVIRLVRHVLHYDDFPQGLQKGYCLLSLWGAQV